MAVQTQIQARRGTAATWTSTNPTLAAGETGYETDTGKFKIGTGSTAWASLGYFNQDPVTTKGDLFTFSTTDARLAVGANGTLLTADSSAATGLSYQNNFAAGKNKIINGDFNIWQRGTSFTPTPGNLDYTADRWIAYSDANHTDTQQTFTPGTAPVAGYESNYFMRIAKSAGGAYLGLAQRIENVRTFAGQTVTVSFWAKASAAITLAGGYSQDFGSGGSTAVSAFSITPTLTTSWARYSATIAIPSISGKTIGTSSYLTIDIGRTLTSSAITIDFWGVQVEEGSVATAFQTATGTLQGELAACQRYYYRIPYSAASQIFGTGQAFSLTAGTIWIPYPVTMRTSPTALEQSGTAANYGLLNASGSAVACNTVPTFAAAFPNGAAVEATVASGLIAGNGTRISGVAGTPYLGWSAEL